MKQTSHKRSPLTGRAIASAAALLLGGGGLIAVNVSADAHQSRQRDSSWQQRAQIQGASTIACPEVVNRIRKVPKRARREVYRDLALLDTQVGDAYRRLVRERATVQRDPSWTRNALLKPLADKRKATISRIVIVIDRYGARPTGLEKLAGCQVKENDTAGGDGQNQGGGGQSGGNQGGRQISGPSPDDFVDITTVQPNVMKPTAGPDASTGTFTSSCGTNENGKFNTDNLIVAPGTANGAHHTHDYVGNQATDAFAGNEDLARGRTTCANQGDKSAYYWPVLRLQNGKDEFDADQDGGGREGNIGEIQRAEQAEITFVGNPAGKVVAMPTFLRIITGDAKAFTNGDANANASWSCTGFEDRQLTDKYPICPEGSKVVRTFHFQSCWDGQNIDSADHRTHVAFAEEDTGACPEGFKAIPQLVQRLVYDVPPPTFDEGQRNVFAVDGFPEQLHKPITDHDDFISVFDEDLMDRMVSCINEGRDCS
jgi:hypothetical protein